VTADASAATTTNAPPANGAPPAADGSTPATPQAKTAQDYLQSFAQSANIWIMAPASWTPEVSNPPPADSSIIRALKNFVAGLHGTMTQAIVLREGAGGGGNRGFGGGDSAWADRMRNAINGLPADARQDALQQLDAEIQFSKDVQALPQDQRRQAMMKHMIEKMLYADSSRLSPDKRAQRYQRLVSARAAMKGH
jgi:hypothetical protein